MSERRAPSKSDAVVRAWCDAFEARAASLPGSGTSWLDQKRREAIAHLEALGLPTPRWEDWRASQPELLAEKVVAPAPPLVSPRLSSVPSAAFALAPGDRRLVFVDGVFAPEVSELGSEPAGVEVASLATRLASDPEALAGSLGALASTKSDPIRALNTALFEDGARVAVAPDTRCEHSIHLLFVSSGAGVLACPRVSVSVAERGCARIVEQHVSQVDSGPRDVCAAVVELDLAPGAELDYVKAQFTGADDLHLAAIDARQRAGSRLRTWSIALGARMARSELSVELQEPGASAELFGLYLGRDAARVDHQVHLDHAAPETTSSQLFKGILADRARGVFQGRVHVRPDAQQIDAGQSHRSLMLSPDASVHARPQLEIYADDVQCSHGNAIGQLDEASLFYLRSRGIPLAEARSILTGAFAEEIVQSLPDSELSTGIAGRVREWLS